MVNISQLRNGIILYLDNELLHKMTGWQKWLTGAYLTRVMAKADDIFKTVKENPAIKALDLIDEDGMIDIDEIYSCISPQAKKESIQLQIPLIGEIKITSDDVDKMYRCITM